MAATQPKLDEQRLHALALDATRGALALQEQIHRALAVPVTVRDLLNYRQDAETVVKGVDWSLLDRAKNAVRELESALDPHVQVRDYRVHFAIEHVTLRQVRAFVDEVSALAEPLLALRTRKKS
jgi:hypothetical protein